MDAARPSRAAAAAAALAAAERRLAAVFVPPPTCICTTADPAFTMPLTAVAVPGGMTSAEASHTQPQLIAGGRIITPTIATSPLGGGTAHGPAHRVVEAASRAVVHTPLAPSDEAAALSAAVRASGAMSPLAAELERALTVSGGGIAASGTAGTSSHRAQAAALAPSPTEVTSASGYKRRRRGNTASFESMSSSHASWQEGAMDHHAGAVGLHDSHRSGSSVRSGGTGPALSSSAVSTESGLGWFHGEAHSRGGIPPGDVAYASSTAAATAYPPLSVPQPFVHQHRSRSDDRAVDSHRAALADAAWHRDHTSGGGRGAHPHWSRSASADVQPLAGVRAVSVDTGVGGGPPLYITVHAASSAGAAAGAGTSGDSHQHAGDESWEATPTTPDPRIAAHVRGPSSSPVGTAWLGGSGTGTASGRHSHRHATAVPPSTSTALRARIHGIGAVAVAASISPHSRTSGDDSPRARAVYRNAQPSISQQMEEKEAHEAWLLPYAAAVAAFTAAAVDRGTRAAAGDPAPPLPSLLPAAVNDPLLIAVRRVVESDLAAAPPPVAVPSASSQARLALDAARLHRRTECAALAQLHRLAMAIKPDCAVAAEPQPPFAPTSMAGEPGVKRTPAQLAARARTLAASAITLALRDIGAHGAQHVTGAAVPLESHAAHRESSGDRSRTTSDALDAGSALLQAAASSGMTFGPPQRGRSVGQRRSRGMGDAMHMARSPSTSSGSSAFSERRSYDQVLSRHNRHGSSRGSGALSKETALHLSLPPPPPPPLHPPDVWQAHPPAVAGPLQIDSDGDVEVVAATRPHAALWARTADEVVPPAAPPLSPIAGGGAVWHTGLLHNLQASPLLHAVTAVPLAAGLPSMSVHLDQLSPQLAPLPTVASVPSLGELGGVARVPSPFSHPSNALTGDGRRGSGRMGPVAIEAPGRVATSPSAGFGLCGPDGPADGLAASTGRGGGDGGAMVLSSSMGSLSDADEGMRLPRYDVGAGSVGMTLSTADGEGAVVVAVAGTWPQTAVTGAGADAAGAGGEWSRPSSTAYADNGGLASSGGGSSCSPAPQEEAGQAHSRGMSVTRDATGMRGRSMSRSRTASRATSPTTVVSLDTTVTRKSEVTIVSDGGGSAPAHISVAGRLPPAAEVAGRTIAGADAGGSSSQRMVWLAGTATSTMATGAAADPLHGGDDPPMKSPMGYRSTSESASQLRSGWRQHGHGTCVAPASAEVAPDMPTCAAEAGIAATDASAAASCLRTLLGAYHRNAAGPGGMPVDAFAASLQLAERRLRHNLADEVTTHLCTMSEEVEAQCGIINGQLLLAHGLGVVAASAEAGASASQVLQAQGSWGSGDAAELGVQLLAELRLSEEQGRRLREVLEASACAPAPPASALPSTALAVAAAALASRHQHQRASQHYAIHNVHRIAAEVGAALQAEATVVGEGVPRVRKGRRRADPDGMTLADMQHMLSRHLQWQLPGAAAVHHRNLLLWLAKQPVAAWCGPSDAPLALDAATDRSTGATDAVLHELSARLVACGGWLATLGGYAVGHRLALADAAAGGDAATPASSSPSSGALSPRDATALTYVDVGAGWQNSGAAMATTAVVPAVLDAWFARLRVRISPESGV